MDYFNYDSRTQYNTTDGKLWGTSVPGSYEYTSSTAATATDCQFTTPELREFSINVLKCEPPFNEQGTAPNVVVPRLQATNIAVYLPSGMAQLSQALNDAINDMNNNFADVGPIFGAPSASDCGGGGTCVRFEEGLIPPVDGVFPCSKYALSYDPNTGILTAATITLQDGWWNVNDGRLQRTIVHELTHLSGLKDAEVSCAGADSVMRVGAYACDASGVPNTLTVTDTLPVRKGVYGGGPRVSCGF